jgi:hypothetical protein
LLLDALTLVFLSTPAFDGLRFDSALHTNSPLDLNRLRIELALLLTPPANGQASLPRVISATEAILHSEGCRVNLTPAIGITCCKISLSRIQARSRISAERFMFRVPESGSGYTTGFMVCH